MRTNFYITLSMTGSSMELMDWIDMDLFLVLEECGFSFLELRTGASEMEKWTDFSDNYINIIAIAQHDIDCTNVRNALNENIKKCGFENLVVKQVSIDTAKGPYFSDPKD